MKRITLLLIALGFTIISNAQTAPVINCPASPVEANSDAGTCGAVVNFAVSAVDAEDGALTPTQTAGPASGDVFPVGTTNVAFSVTDNDGYTVTCDFDVVVSDTELPVAVCQNYTVALDAGGAASIVAADVDNGSSDNCAGFTLSVSPNTFDCSNVGDNTVTLTVTDASGNEATCNATVTVEDNQAPVVICKGGGGSITLTENFDGCALPSGWSLEADMAGYDHEGACDASGTDGLFSFSCTDGDYVGFPGGDNSNFSGCKAVINDDNAGSAYQGNASLLSPVISLAGGSGNNLTFDYAFNNLGSSAFIVEAWNGASWDELLLVNTDTVDSADIDISAYSNADFQVRFRHDDGGSWAWGVAIDNVAISYTTATTDPLEVSLNADGTIEVAPDDLIFSVTDNCSVTAGGGALPCTQSNASNGFENGSAIDLDFQTANDLSIDAGGSDFVLNQVTANLFHAVGETVASVDFYYYEDNAGAPGAQIGSQMSVVPTSQNVVGNNFGFDVSEVVFDLTPFTFAADASNAKTYWIGMKGISSAGGRLFWEDQSANIAGNEIYVFDGTSWGPQAGLDGVYVFAAEANGECGYDTNPIVFDCSNLGENSVDVSVTDAGGNVAICTATVIVSDVTAPVLECGPEPTLYGSDTAMDSPALTIASGTTATSVINITDDYNIDDLNIYVNFSCPSLNELNIDITSPAGTTQNLFFPIGACAGTPDLNFYFDDEGISSNILCTDLQTGGHYNIAAVLGLDPLSTFDGESLQGDWTITVTAGASGDTVINTWGLEYDYSYANPSSDIIIELDENGQHTLTADDMLYTQEDACGIDVLLLDVTEPLTCSDIGDPIMVTVFANDASGNFASCQHEINVVDAMAPTLTCPGDMIVPSNDDGVYVLPDYFATGEALATDNCTADADIVLTQDPAPGYVSGITEGTGSDPVHVTFTATDAYGNVATCEFDLGIKNGIGVTENSILDAQVSLQPNPASDRVTLVNYSEIALQTAMVYNIDGKLVATIDLSKNSTFSVADLASGVYMVKITGTDATAVKRLMVK